MFKLHGRRQNSRWIVDSLEFYFSFSQSMINKDCNMVVLYLCCYKADILINHICVSKGRFSISCIVFIWSYTETLHNQVLTDTHTLSTPAKALSYAYISTRKFTYWPLESTASSVFTSFSQDHDSENVDPSLFAPGPQAVTDPVWWYVDAPGWRVWPLVWWP